MSDNEKLAEELKAIADSMKAMGQYTQDVQRAMRELLRPMQEMSEYMHAAAKASEESKDSNKKLLDDLSATVGKMGEIAQAVKERNKNSEDSNKLSEERLKLHQQQEERIKKQQEEQKKLSEVDKARNKDIDLTNKAVAAQKDMWGNVLDMVKEQEAAQIKLGYRINENTGKLEVQNAILVARTKLGSAGMQALTGNTSATGIMSQIGSGISSLMPTIGGFGGLIGMILNGINQEEHFRSVGEQAAQIFDQVGGHSDKLAGQLGGASRTLSKWGQAAEGDLLAVSTALTQMGVSGAEAEQQMKGLVGTAGTNLVTSMLAADKAFEMASGSMAQMAGALAKDFNMPIKEAATSMMNLGDAAARAGFNAAGMMQSAMQAASALRLLNANGQDVGATMFGLAEGMAGAGFNKQFSQQYAQAGMTSATGAVAGMDVGMSAIIGERLDYGSGLDAWYAMKSPKGRDADKKLDVGDILGEMRGIVEELSPNRSEQAFALEKLFGVDTAGADAILDAIKEQSETGKLSKQAQERLNNAFMSEGEKANKMLQMVEVIKDAVAKVSVGLLQMVVNGLKYIVDSVKYLAATLMSSSLINSDEESRKYNEDLASSYEMDLAADERGFKAGWGRVTESAQTIKKATGVELGIAGGASGISSPGESMRQQAFERYTKGVPLTPEQEKKILDNIYQDTKGVEVTAAEMEELTIIVKRGSRKKAKDYSGGGTPRR